MDQEQKDKLAKALGISKEDQQILDIGAGHPYTCRCGVCKEFWQEMGPEEPENPYGPFTIAEIEDGSERGEQCKRWREEMILEDEADLDRRFDIENQ